MTESEMVLLVSSATTYANGLQALFSQFLSVVFGSLALSAAVSLRHVGRHCYIRTLHLSYSSLLLAFVITVYFVISFFTFHSMSIKLKGLLDTLHIHMTAKQWEEKFPHALQAFESEPIYIGSLNLPSIGFILGSLVTVIAFLWIANADRGRKI